MVANVAIVGAGIAGLTCAEALQRAGVDVVVLEARRSVGGRIRSVSTGEGVDYEAGPWRIPEEHTEMLKLCRKLGIALQPLRTPTLSTAEEDGYAGLSIWESTAYTTRSVASADSADLATGYAGQTAAAAGSSPYTAGASKVYYVAPGGFQEIADRLAEGLHGDAVRLDHRVVDVQRTEDGRYRLDVSVRGEWIERKVFHTSALFVCIPPSQCRDWKIMKEHAQPVLDAVEPGCLNHVYARQLPGTASPAPFHRRAPKSLLQQTISDQYGRGWFQASYSAGRIARFWYDLFLVNASAMRTLLASLVRAETPVRGRMDPDSATVHFWHEAYHHWVAAPGFNLRHAVDAATRPHPVKLPNVFLCGEAFSAHQAWMEGARRTALRAVRAYLHPVSVQRRRRAADEICVDGRLVDVSEFQHVHPGSLGAIRSHIEDEDVAELLRHIGHSKTANAIIFNLQSGWGS